MGRPRNPEVIVRSQAEGEGGNEVGGEERRKAETEGSQEPEAEEMRKEKGEGRTEAGREGEKRKSWGM